MSSGLECHGERARYASVRRREGERRREEILRVERQREYRISISHVSICLLSDYTDYFHRSFSLELYIGFDGILGQMFCEQGGRAGLLCVSTFTTRYSVKNIQLNSLVFLSNLFSGV